MKNKLYVLPMLLSILLLGACTNKQKTPDKTKNESVVEEQRIISLNGAITEIIYALDPAAPLVGRDVTSTYPEWIVDSVPDLGHVRSLNIESLVNLKPTLVMAGSSDLNEDLENSIRDLGWEYKVFNQEFTVDGAKSLIAEVGDFIGHPNPEKVLSKIDADMEQVQAFTTPPKVLFIYARGAGTLMVAGQGTPMESMIELAGGQNAVVGFKDFKPLTEEALLDSNPDVLLLFDSGLQSLGGKEGLLKTTPGISKTQAGKNKAILAMDGGLLTDFGPRLGQAVVELNELLQEYAK